MELIVLTLLLSGLVSAFGVSSDYWKGNPLKISPGETKTISLRLQNMVGSEDINVRAVLIKGSEIASIDERDYLVRYGTKDTEVLITVKIPSDVQVDTNYEVTISFKTLAPGEEGVVSIGTGVDTTFDVLVVPVAPVVTAEEPQLAPSLRSNLAWYVIGAIVLLIIIVIIVMLKKKKEKKVE